MADLVSPEARMTTTRSHEVVTTRRHDAFRRTQRGWVGLPSGLCTRASRRLGVAKRRNGCAVSCVPDTPRREAFSLMERPPAGGTARPGAFAVMRTATEGWAPDPKNLVFLKLAAQGHRGEGERHAVLKSSGVGS